MNPGTADPDVKDLTARLEAASDGRKVRRLVRCRRGAQSLNFAGEWAGGARFALKLVPFARAKQYARLVDHLEKTAPGPVVRESAPRIRFDVGGFHALVLDWCEGETLGFEALDDVEGLVAGYGDFSKTVQDVGELYPTYDYATMHDEVMATAIAAALPREAWDADYAALAEGMRVIHGDLQPDNLRFVGGRLASVLDIEEFRRGHPAEDFARYVCNSADRLPWFAFVRRRRIVRSVARLVAAAGFTASVWEAAVFGQLLEKARKNVRKGRVSAVRLVNLKWRGRFYARLARAVNVKGSDQ